MEKFIFTFVRPDEILNFVYNILYDSRFDGKNSLLG